MRQFSINVFCFCLNPFEIHVKSYQRIQKNHTRSPMERNRLKSKKIESMWVYCVVSQKGVRCVKAQIWMLLIIWNGWCWGGEKEKRNVRVWKNGQNQKKTPHAHKRNTLDFSLLHIEPTQCLIWMVDFILNAFLNVIFFSVVKRIVRKTKTSIALAVCCWSQSLILHSRKIKQITSIAFYSRRARFS